MRFRAGQTLAGRTEASLRTFYYMHHGDDAGRDVRLRHSPPTPGNETFNRLQA